MIEFFVRRKQFLIYLVGGLLSAAIDICVMQLLIWHTVDYKMATSIGFASGLLINFAYHAKFTFRSTTSPSNFIRYICVVAVNYLMTLIIVAIAVALISMPTQVSSLIGKIVSLPIIAIVGYVLSKYWIYR